MKGFIRHIPHDKHFAFIEATNGASVFVHKDDYEGDWQQLATAHRVGTLGDLKVTFDLIDTGKGPRAEHCRLIEFHESTCTSCNGLGIVEDPQHGMSIFCEKCSGKGHYVSNDR